MSYQIAHFSDIHLGYEAYAARSQRGHNQRGEDVVRALHRVVDDIVAADPPLVICSGDVAELPHVPVRYMLAAASEFQRLAALRPDGSRRQLVVIAGNHDQSKHLRDGCFLELYRGLPGVHVVTAGYRQVTFDADAEAPRELDGTVVHALPHDSLRDLDELGVAPVEGRVNVLTAHGVAESSDLFRRAVGREYVIPAELMVMDWEYVALGHWHAQGPVFPMGVKRSRSRIWYAGSVESVDFGDVKGSRCDERGWLLVDVRPGDDPDVKPQRHPVRPMVNLPTVDASKLDAEQLREILVANLGKGDLAGSVVRQRVVEVSRDLWALVDTASVHAAATELLHYRLEPRFAKEEVAGAADGQPRGLARVGSLLAAQVEADVPEAHREAVLEMARRLLRDVAVEVAPQEAGEDGENGDGTADASAAEALVPAAPVAPVEDAPLEDVPVPEAAGAMPAPSEDVPVGPPAAVAIGPAEEADTVGEEAADGAVAPTIPAALGEAERDAAVRGVLAEFDGLFISEEGEK